jgi:hypothetical protein
MRCTASSAYRRCPPLDAPPRAILPLHSSGSPKRSVPFVSPALQSSPPPPGKRPHLPHQIPLDVKPTLTSSIVR